MANAFVVIIPARLGSTRLFNKVLADIGNLPMVVRVAQQAMKSQAQRVCVATDSTEVLKVCQLHAIEALMTRSDHASGTDRIAEAAKHMGLSDSSVIVNVQADEPLINPQLIHQCAQGIDHDVMMATMCKVIKQEQDFHNPNIVKVICNTQNQALYFSRAAIPYTRDTQGKLTPNAAFHHIGIYAFRMDFLQRYAQLPKTALEQIEQLEQLRALYAGYKISVQTWNSELAHGVDTAEDLERVRSYFK